MKVTNITLVSFNVVVIIVISSCNAVTENGEQLAVAIRRVRACWRRLATVSTSTARHTTAGCNRYNPRLSLL